MPQYVNADKLKTDILAKYKKHWEVPCSSEDRLIQSIVTDLRVLIEKNTTADVAPIADTVQKMQGMFENAISELHTYYTDDSYEPMVFPSEVLELLDKIVKEMLGGSNDT